MSDASPCLIMRGASSTKYIQGDMLLWWYDAPCDIHQERRFWVCASKWLLFVNGGVYFESKVSSSWWGHLVESRMKATHIVETWRAIRIIIVAAYTWWGPWGSPSLFNGTLWYDTWIRVIWWSEMHSLGCSLSLKWTMRCNLSKNCTRDFVELPTGEGASQSLGILSKTWWTRAD